MKLKQMLSIVTLIALIACFASFSAPLHAEKQRASTAWAEEHSGAPYVGAIVHYVLPEGFRNAGHPRAALVTRAGYDHNAVDLQVFLSRDDVEPDEPATLNLSQVRADCCGEFGTWHWPPDPRNLRTSGQ